MGTFQVLDLPTATPCTKSRLTTLSRSQSLGGGGSFGTPCIFIMAYITCFQFLGKTSQSVSDREKFRKKMY